MDTIITVPEKTITISDLLKKAIIFAAGAIWGGAIAYNQIFQDPNKQPSGEGLVIFLSMVIITTIVPIILLDAIKRNKGSEGQPKTTETASE